MDGFQVAKLIRSKDLQTAIILLTARAADEDRVSGFKVGVDDYITKPFHLQELLLRVKRMMARAGLLGAGASETLLRSGPFELDTEGLRLRSPNGTYDLTALEANVLAEFMKNPKRVLSREHLLEKVWGMSASMETRTVDNFIVRLRRFLEKDPQNPAYLVSVRGRGYRFLDEGPKSHAPAF